MGIKARGRRERWGRNTTEENENILIEGKSIFEGGKWREQKTKNEINAFSSFSQFSKPSAVVLFDKFYYCNFLFFTDRCDGSLFTFWEGRKTYCYKWQMCIWKYFVVNGGMFREDNPLGHYYLFSSKKKGYTWRWGRWKTAKKRINVIQRKVQIMENICEPHIDAFAIK